MGYDTVGSCISQLHWDGKVPSREVDGKGLIQNPASGNLSLVSSESGPPRAGTLRHPWQGSVSDTLSVTSIN